MMCNQEIRLRLHISSLKKALTEKVIDALVENFAHYESATIEDGVLTLVHPDKE